MFIKEQLQKEEGGEGELDSQTDKTQYGRKNFKKSVKVLFLNA